MTDIDPTDIATAETGQLRWTGVVALRHVPTVESDPRVIRGKPVLLETPAPLWWCPEDLHDPTDTHAGKLVIGQVDRLRTRGDQIIASGRLNSAPDVILDTLTAGGSWPCSIEFVRWVQFRDADGLLVHADPIVSGVVLVPEGTRGAFPGAAIAIDLSRWKLQASSAPG